MREVLEVLDNVRLNFSATSLLALNITIAFVMFGVALELKPSHLKNVFAKPKSVFVGLLSQFFLLPLTTFLLIILLNPTPTVAMGMILIASCPGGNVSNFMSALAKGNVALSVSLTAISTLGATFITPLNFALWGGLYLKNYGAAEDGSYLVPIEIDFLQMLQTVVVLLLIPVISGVLFSMFLPSITIKIKKPIRQLSLIIFIILVFVLLLVNFDNFMKFIYLVFIIVFIHNGLALAMGFFTATLFKLPQTDTRTISIETGIQNSGLALALMFNPKIFPPELALGGMTIIAAWWGVWHIISGLALSMFWSRKQP